MVQDHLVQRMRFGSTPSVVAFVTSEDDPIQTFREEVTQKRQQRAIGRPRHGDMHRWCGRRKAVRVHGVRFVIYVEG